ncbi:MAG: hypothetical protein AAFQ44_08515 [Pseudomonadota bacterium]
MARLDYDFEGVEGQAASLITGDILFELGLKYSIGRDVEICLVSAHKWFNLAASKGHEGARGHRADIARELSRADVSKAQRLARAWLRGE